MEQFKEFVVKYFKIIVVVLSFSLTLYIQHVNNTAQIAELETKCIGLEVDKGGPTAKRWAKLAKVSPDTAVRDVQYLAEIGILIPEEGAKVRNIAYGIKIGADQRYFPGGFNLSNTMSQ